MGCVAMVGALTVARVLVDPVAALVHANGDPWVMTPLIPRSARGQPEPRRLFAFHPRLPKTNASTWPLLALAPT